jgi:two-component sensor histidine kinase
MARRYRTAMVVVAAWVVLMLAFAVPEYFLSRYLGEPETWQRALLGVAPHYVLWAMLGVFIAGAARRWPIERPRLASRVVLHLFLSFAFYGIDGLVSFAVLPAILRDPQLTPFTLRALLIRGFYDDFLLYWGIVGVVHLAVYHRNLMAETSRRVQLERAFAAVQLSALRSQIQPHFLFNTLNSISELVHVDARAAERMTGALADLLRGTLELGDRDEIPLRDELQLLELYLAIQQVRFSDSITVERDLDPAALPALVPPLLLQPLVENAFRHGLARRRQQGRLVIRTRRDGDRLQLEVRDNGSGLPDEVHEGVGLRNSRVRLEQLHGSAASLRLDEPEDGGTRVVVEMPYREPEP